LGAVTTIYRWEHGLSRPQPWIRQNLDMVEAYLRAEQLAWRLVNL
jgi:hypothetical protein